MNSFVAMFFVMLTMQSTSQEVDDQHVSATSIQALESEALAGQLSVTDGLHQRENMRIKSATIWDCTIFFETSFDSGVLKGITLDLSEFGSITSFRAGEIELMKSTNKPVLLNIGDTSHTKHLLAALVDIQNHCRNPAPIF